MAPDEDDDDVFACYSLVSCCTVAPAPLLPWNPVQTSGPGWPSSSAADATSAGTAGLGMPGDFSFRTALKCSSFAQSSGQSVQSTSSSGVFRASRLCNVTKAPVSLGEALSVVQNDRVGPQDVRLKVNGGFATLLNDLLQPSVHVLSPVLVLKARAVPEVRL